MRRITADDPIPLDELRRLVPGRPSVGNRSRGGIDDAATREAVGTLVESLVRR